MWGFDLDPDFIPTALMAIGDGVVEGAKAIAHLSFVFVKESSDLVSDDGEGVVFQRIIRKSDECPLSTDKCVNEGCPCERIWRKMKLRNFVEKGLDASDGSGFSSTRMPTDEDV